MERDGIFTKMMIPMNRSTAYTYAASILPDAVAAAEYLCAPRCVGSRAGLAIHILTSLYPSAYCYSLLEKSNTPLFNCQMNLTPCSYRPHMSRTLVARPAGIGQTEIAAPLMAEPRQYILFHQ